MLRDVSADNTADALGEASPSTDGGVLVLAFNGGPELFEDGRALNGEKEGKNENEDNVGSDLGNSADAGDENVTEVTDKVIGEVFDGGEDFALEVFDTEGLAEVIDAVPATDSVFKGGGELADELDGLVDNDRYNDGHNET